MQTNCKQIAIIILFIIFSSDNFAQTHFSYLQGGKKQYFSLSKDKLFVKFEEQSSQEKRKSISNQYAPTLASRHSLKSIELLPLPFFPKEEDVWDFARKASQEDGVEYTYPKKNLNRYSE